MPPLNWRLSIEGWPTLIVDAMGAILGANAVTVSIGVPDIDKSKMLQKPQPSYCGTI